MNKVVFICLLTLSINAVLIQTVTADNFALKNGIRVCLLALMVLLLLIKKKPVLIGLFFLLDISIILMLLGRNPDQLSFVFIFIFIQVMLLVESQRRVEKYILISSLASFSLIFIFLLLGITENVVEEYRNRMTFGTNGVPFFYNMVYGTFSLLVVYSQKYFDRFKGLITLISLGATTYFYFMTNLRGGYFSFLIFLFLLYVIPKTRRISLFRIFVGIIPVFALFLSFLLAYLSNNSYINQTLSYRPVLLRNFFESINVADVFLSASVKNFGSVGIVDNSYIHLFVGGGIIIWMAVCGLFFKAILNLYKHKKYVEISFVIATCLYFNSESIMVRVENVFVIYFWYLIFKYSLTNVEIESKKLNSTIAQKNKLIPVALPKQI